MLAFQKFDVVRDKLASRTATVGICGLGYVGLPLVVAINRAGFNVIGFDIDEVKTEQLNAKTSYLGSVSSEIIIDIHATGRFRATADFAHLAECDVIVICVPTPLTRNREPDLSFIERTAEAIALRLRPAQLIVLESTTYPGTTTEIVKPILERSGFTAGSDFFLAFSPEREDPGNPHFDTQRIPKVVAGDGEAAGKLVRLFYEKIVATVVEVSTTETAEAVKITENIFRAVNIALINELKMIFDAMGIDVWEVIEAAKTKPFGYMPFYPGPGLGGHCIPIDPFYLAWKAREFGMPTRFIELAGEINTAMPKYVVERLAEALDRDHSKRLGDSRILILGIAYKKNVSDMRESPALKLIELLEKRGANVDFHDPHVEVIPPTREHPEFASRRSVDFTKEIANSYDAVLIVTDHDAIDFSLIKDAPLIVDTRNACETSGFSGMNVVKA